MPRDAYTRWHEHKAAQKLASRQACADDPAVAESAYRRGFEHGARQTLAALRVTGSIEAVLRWLDEVRAWRWRDRDKAVKPPEAATDHQ